MKKKIVRRIFSGFMQGIAIGYLITLLISFSRADGYYFVCVPEFISVMGNEINAAALQAVLCGILGAGFSAGSVIFEADNGSLIKQTGIYFLIVSAITLPTAYFLHWMERSLSGFLIYFGFFALIFAIIWIILYFTGKNNVKKMNEKLLQKKDGENKQ